MMEAIRRKLHSARGINRLAAILLALILVLLVVIGIPVARSYKARLDTYNCDLAVDKAQDMIDIAFLQSRSMTLEEAQETVDESLIARDNLCPVYGEFFVLEDQTREQPFTVVCGLHDSDTAERTRLCADRALSRVREAVRTAQMLGTPVPETVTVTLNGKDLTASLVYEETGPVRGTYATTGYEGTVVFYGLAGQGAFAGFDGVEDGEVCYFCYADEDHAANWLGGTGRRSGWSGDSWDGQTSLHLASSDTTATADD